MAAGWNKDKKGKPLSEAHKRKIALALQGNQHALGLVHTDESKEKMSIGHKGQIPWNKGIKAWNNGQRWPVEVKENISKGMIQMWQRRKEGINCNSKKNTRRLIHNIALPSLEDGSVELQNNRVQTPEDCTL